MSYHPSTDEICSNWTAHAFRRVDTVLSEGERWLTTADYWQEGDTYKAAPEWWTVNPAWWGYPVDLGSICYTPKGSSQRTRTL